MRWVSLAASRLKVRRARLLALSMLSLSVLLVLLGLYTSTRAENLSVSGYGSGAVVSRSSVPLTAQLLVQTGVLTVVLCSSLWDPSWLCWDSVWRRTASSW